MVEVSKRDVTANITLPKELTTELAELIGIIIGDGHLSSLQRIGRIQRELFIAGNREEREYINHIIDIFYSQFHYTLRYREDKRSKAILLTAHSKGIVHYLSKVCGIPTGKKVDSVQIPSLIKNSSIPLKCAFLRGLADTDFYTTFKKNSSGRYCYPHIKGSFKSKLLVQDVENLLAELNFKYSVYYDENRFDKRFNTHFKMHNIYLNGNKNFEKWLELIGTYQQKVLLKIEKWRKDGQCPPPESPRRELNFRSEESRNLLMS